MKALVAIVAAVVLAVAPGPCFALRSIGIVTKKDAKEMGLEVRTLGNGPQVWVELEFKPEGKLKHFHHVELEAHEGDKMLVSYAPLQHRRLDSGRVVVRFLADRGHVEKLTLTVVAGDFGDVGYEVRLRDFVEPKKDR